VKKKKKRPRRKGAANRVAQSQNGPRPLFASHHLHLTHHAKKATWPSVCFARQTPTSLVLKYAGLHPGEPITYPLLRLAEKWLAASGLFVVDEQEGVRPTITVIEGEDGTYRDILIVVKDKGHRRSRRR
jgi:hypothetical protein